MNNIDFLMVENVFYLGLSLLFVHELDAIRCREWRIFPGLSMFKDRPGFIVFIFAHIPLFFGILWCVNNITPTIIRNFNIFMIIHLFLHILFLKHKNNEFKDWVSWLIIIAIALCGIVGLFLE